MLNIHMQKFYWNYPIKLEHGPRCEDLMAAQLNIALAILKTSMLIDLNMLKIHQTAFTSCEENYHCLTCLVPF